VKTAPKAAVEKKAVVAKKSVAKSDAAPKKAAVKKAAPKKAAVKGTRTANAAFMRPVQPDSALGAVVGTKPLPRTEITKGLWDYIKKNGLQDAQNKRNINADDKLKVIFGGKKSITMFEMAKYVGQHVS
jgi:chromatin remodeling complex protein RSC6